MGISAAIRVHRGANKAMFDINLVYSAPILRDIGGSTLMCRSLTRQRGGSVWDDVSLHWDGGDPG